MIKKWKISNFKCFREEVELTLGRLTLLAGPNNSGKSSIIETMLLVCQSLAGTSGPGIILNGRLVKLGQPLDILYSCREYITLPSDEWNPSSIEIGWECGSLGGEQGPKVHVYGGDEKVAANRPLGLQKTTVSCSITLGFKSRRPEARFFAEMLPLKCRISSGPRDGHDSHFHCIATLPDKEDGDDELPFFMMRKSQSQAGNDTTYEVELDEAALSELMSEFTDGRLDGCTLNGFLPSHLLVSYDRHKQLSGEIEQAIRAAADENRPPVFLRSSWRFGLGYEGAIPAAVLELLAGYVGEDCLDADIGREDMNIRDWYRMLSGMPLERRALLDRKVSRLLADNEAWAAVRKTIDAEISVQTAPASAEPPEARENNGLETARVRMPGKLMRAVFQTRSMFPGQVRYVGPLRDEPIVFQPVTATPALNDVGTRGEQAAALLHQKKDDKIAFIPPENFATAEIKLAARVDILTDAVNSWLRYLGVGEQLFSFDGDRLGHSIGVRTSPKEMTRPLTSVGVGASQVIPIIIICLLAEEDTTLIFEQPEQHLHPYVQSRLADFFLSIILMKKQCIIETHSEYLLERLRMRVAAMDGAAGGTDAEVTVAGGSGDAAPRDGSLASLVKAYFVEKCPDGSLVREIPAGRFGVLTGWPSDFHDSSQQGAENILRVTGEEWEKVLGYGDLDYGGN